MSSSKANKGKGKATQSELPPRPTQRSRRQQVSEEISRQFAERLQAEEDRRLDEMLHRIEEQNFEFSGGSNEEDEEGEGEGESNGEGEGEDQTQMPPPSRIPKSDIFTKHFKKVEVLATSAQPPLPDGRKRYMAYCNYCVNSYKFIEKGGYGTLTRHLKNFHPTEFGISRAQTQINFAPTTSTGTGMSSTPLFKFEKERYENACARYCAMEKQPFSYADRITYEATYQDGLGPNVSKVARTQVLKRIRRQCMIKKADLGMYLHRLVHRLAICSDVWTDSYGMSSYMGITCHWIDAKWRMQKRLIAFREFEEPHNANGIAILIITVLNEFRLVNKVFSVGFDNATSNTASIPQLQEACTPLFNGKFFHSRCICHILNLCVQDALSIFDESVTPIRNAVKYLHKNKPLGKKWQKYCRSKNLKYTCFKADVSHRWNSTYEMLESTVEYKGHLVDFYRQEFTQIKLVLNTSHWDACMDLYRLLKCFHSATKSLSGVYYCTSVKVLEHCMYIALSFNSCFSKPNLQGVIYFMVQKWLKYFREIPMVFLVAKCLDPKWRYEGVCQILTIYYDAFRQMDYSNVVIDGEEIFFDLPDVDRIKMDLDRTLRSLFNEYRAAHPDIDIYANVAPTTTIDSSDYPFEVTNLDNESPLVLQMHDMYLKRMQELHIGQGNSELDIFMQSRIVFAPDENKPSIDVLRWWSKKEEDYPILSMMAKEFFSVPASTVSVEQAFSIGGLMLDQRRSTMKPDNIEATMLLDDWCRADLRAQEPDWEGDRNESEDEAYTETDRSGTGTGTDRSGATSEAD